VAHYQYTVSQILISVKCFLGSSAGFRGLSSVFQIIKEYISSIAAPAHTTIRQWLLKIGLYKLQRPKHSSQSWFWIIDTTIQMGSQKCVLVLGVKQQDVTENFCPTFSQVEPLVLKPLESCPGEVIREILEEASTKTGRPTAIISDAGSELKKGVRLFSENSDVVHLFDISHKVNTCLKAELSGDLIWKEFKKTAGDSVQHLKLSPVSHLAPPRQRTKERMHSAFPLIQWGLRLSSYVNSEGFLQLSVTSKSKITWIRKYQISLETHSSLMKIGKKALQLVHERGYYRWIEDDFVALTEEFCKTDTRCIDFREKIAAILRTEGQKVPDGQHYLGSSEIIESMFGKFKAMEDHHSSSGLTSLVLAIPALAGEIGEREVYQAMNSISTSDVENWIEQNMGKTFLSKRRSALTKPEILKKEEYTHANNLESCDFTQLFMG